MNQYTLYKKLYEWSFINRSMVKVLLFLFLNVYSHRMLKINFSKQHITSKYQILYIMFYSAHILIKNECVKSLEHMVFHKHVHSFNFSVQVQSYF